MRLARATWLNQLNRSGSTDRFILGGAAISILTRIAGVGLSYAANVLLSRLLGLHYFGQYAIALGWALVLTIPARFGFENSALRYGTIYFESGDFEALRGFIRTATIIVTGVSLLIGAIVVAIGYHLGKADRQLVFWTAAIILPLTLLGLYSSLLRISRKIFASQVYDQVLRPLFVVAGAIIVAFAAIRLNPAGALRLTAAAAYAALLLLLLHFQRAFRQIRGRSPRYEQLRQWFSLSLPMLIMGVVQELLNQIDIILLGILASAREAGLFAAAWRLASLVIFLLAGLTTVGGPLVSSAYHRGDREELLRVAAIVSRLGFAFAVLAALALAAFGPWLLLIFGAEFIAAYPALLVLLLGGLANAFTGIVAYLMTMTGHERPALVMFVGALALSLLLNLILIPRFGAIGAAVSSSSAVAAWNFAMLFYVRRTIDIDASPFARR